MKPEKIIRGELLAPINLGKPVAIHRDDQAPGRVWQSSPVEKIVSVAIMNGKVGVKFETENTIYTAAFSIQ